MVLDHPRIGFTNKRLENGCRDVIVVIRSQCIANIVQQSADDIFIIPSIAKRTGGRLQRVCVRSTGKQPKSPSRSLRWAITRSGSALANRLNSLKINCQSSFSLSCKDLNFACVFMISISSMRIMKKASINDAIYWLYYWVITIPRQSCPAPITQVIPSQNYS